MHKLVLFDFDGTLADTAPDLAAAANKQRARRGLPPLPYEALRPYASHGARGLLKASLDMDTDHPDYPACREQFLEDYEQDMTTHTTLFPGIKDLLALLKENGYAWGIVTNKVEYLAIPLVVHLGLYTDCAITVGGDTTSHPKPHPPPFLHAAKQTCF
jgi:phosphoglycolate phosphatase